MIVFLRPSGIGYAVQSSVFEIVDEKPLLVGIVAAKKKLAYLLEPGKHVFMVIGENADFISTQLEANRTYYAIISPKMGLWKARFAFKAVDQDQLKTIQFNQWLGACEGVKKTADSELWVKNNLSSILSKYHEYHQDWVSKSWTDRSRLQIQDGKQSSAFLQLKAKENDSDLQDYYSPQDAIDNYDEGEYEYVLPQNQQSINNLSIPKRVTTD